MRGQEFDSANFATRLQSLSNNLEARYAHLNTAISILKSHDLCPTGSDTATEHTKTTRLRNFVIENIAWFSCLASTTLRLNRAMSFPLHEDVVQKLVNLSSSISCEDISGCHEWVRAAFFDVINLKNRMLQAEVDRNRLASRGLEIEEGIERRILQHLLPAATFGGKLKCLEETVDVDEAMGINGGEDPTFPNMGCQLKTKRVWRKWRRRMVFCISYFFSTAVVVYLDALLHDPDPNRPKIRYGVSRATLALSLLETDDIRELTPHLLWPLYVLGCLAERSQQLTIYNILEAGRNDRADLALLLRCYDEISQNRQAHLATATQWTWSAMTGSTNNSILII